MTSLAPLRKEPTRRRVGGWRTFTHGLGELFITLGILILLFVAYELWWTGFYTQRAQHDTITALHHTWSTLPASPAAPHTGGRVAPHTGGRVAPHTGSHAGPASVTTPSNGTGIAIVRIPRLGADYAFAVVQGVGTDDLKKGPGHYPRTAMPGQVGNFAVAGHRTTYLHPFYSVNELGKGDPIVIETAKTWLTYRVSSSEVVDPHDVATIAPVPDHPGKTPHQRWLTLTTCNPRYSAAQRLIVHAKLAGRQSKSAGSPTALRGSATAGKE